MLVRSRTGIEIHGIHECTGYISVPVGINADTVRAISAIVSPSEDAGVITGGIEFAQVSVGELLCRGPTLVDSGARIEIDRAAEGACNINIVAVINCHTADRDRLASAKGQRTDESAVRVKRAEEDGSIACGAV